MGVVQGAGHGGDDGQDMSDGHALRVALLQEVAEVGAVDVVHRDPQPPVVLTPVVDGHDVGMA